MTQNFFLYARKSSESEERQMLSIEAQLAELKNFAKQHNLKITEVFTESQTAKKPGRPIFNEMLTRLQNGDASGIIAWHPDRLARNSVDSGQIVHLLDNKIITTLKFPSFWFENTSQGKFFLNVAFSQSKYYVDNLSDNVKRGLRQKLRRGEWPGWAPVGYLNDKKTGKIVPDPIMAPLVKKLFETYATGRYSLRELKDATKKWGLVGRSGKPFVKAEVQRTLKNSIHYGVMVYNGEAHQGTHEPIITKKLYDRVQKIMKSKSRPRQQNNSSRFPFSGLAHCHNCGCAITAERQKGHHYYRCTKKAGPCDERYVREEILADQISQAISSVALPQSSFDYLSKKMNAFEQRASQEIAQQKNQIEQRISEANEKIDRLLDAHLDGLVTKSEYQTKKAKLVDEKVTQEEKFGLVSQMQRAAVSVPANIAEGYGRQYPKEFRQFCFVSLASCFELETLSIIASSQNYFEREAFDTIAEMINHEC